MATFRLVVPLHLVEPTQADVTTMIDKVRALHSDTEVISQGQSDIELVIRLDAETELEAERRACGVVAAALYYAGFTRENSQIHDPKARPLH